MRPAPQPARAKPLAAKVPTPASQHELILTALGKAGTGTAHEIAIFCRLTAHEIGKRLPEMEALRMVAPVMDGAGKVVTRATPKGRKARVWRVA
jgi:hypothetical protein